MTIRNELSTELVDESEPSTAASGLRGGGCGSRADDDTAADAAVLCRLQEVDESTSGSAGLVESVTGWLSPGMEDRGSGVELEHASEMGKAPESL